MFRKDRSRNGGDVGIYANDNLSIKRMTDLELDSLEIVLVELVLNKKKIMIGSCYCPPGENAEQVDSFLDSFQLTHYCLNQWNPFFSQETFFFIFNNLFVY